MNRAEPRFDIDLAYGKQGEMLVGSMLEWIANGNGRVEVKRKAFLDFELYVETECDKGRTGHYAPSGINVTTAEVWAFVVADSGLALMIPTTLLRASLEHRSARPKETLVGNCPTRGILVNLAAIMDTAKQR